MMCKKAYNISTLDFENVVFYTLNNKVKHENNKEITDIFPCSVLFVNNGDSTDAPLQPSC